MIKVSFALDKTCWVCTKWMLHSTRPVAIQSRNGNGNEVNLVTVECSNQFAHTQQFLSNAKLTLVNIHLKTFILLDLNQFLAKSVLFA